MVATTRARIGVDRRTMPRGLLDRKTASRFAGLVFFAVVSLVASAVITGRAWNARDWAHQSGEIQLKIDRIAWRLIQLEQAGQARADDHDPQRTRLFDAIRSELRDDLVAVTRLTPNNPYLQLRITELDAAFERYFANLDGMFAQDPQPSVDQVRAAVADVGALSQLLSEMRDHEDNLLKQRSERADTLVAVLLPTLSVSATLIGVLVAFVGRAIHRTLRARDLVLSKKDGELAAKDIMMREIDHRVRNSLNLIYSLMMFQQRRTVDASARTLLTEAANQVLVVARVHERLYKYGSMEAVELGDYLRDLCSDVAAFSLPAEARAAIQLHSARTEVGAEEAVWLGLIVVELVTNAVKYGNPSLQSPITIDVSPDEMELRVVVADGGAGLPAGFELTASKGLGMQVVLMLVRQLHATLEVDPTWAGSRFILTVPLTAARSLERRLRRTDQAA